MFLRALLLIPMLVATAAAADFVPTGRSDFFILEPNEQWVYEGVEKRVKTRLTVTVLAETKSIDGVETRVVEEKRTAGKAATTQRSHFALNGRRDAYQFAPPMRLVIPADPLVGQKLDESTQVVSLTESVKVPAGSFTNCMKITRDGVETLYARGVGAVQIGELKLIRHGKKKIDQPKFTVETPDLEPIIPNELAREALNYVGVDPAAEDVWIQAINDPALTPHQRSDLIEDLNETGFSENNGKRATVEDLPIVLNRLDLIDRLVPDAMDEVNYDAFLEAHKDLVNIARRLSDSQQ